MINAPKKIYIQIDADGETPQDFNELAAVTWSTTRVYKNDIVYYKKTKRKNKQLKTK